ncbi:MAG: AAA family ATPase [Gemmatimonadaceae bacterium]|nr:AAA family ATPase [Gemmatimonadaceae bacterium]
MPDPVEVIVNLARLGLRGDPEGVRLYVRRLLRHIAQAEDQVDLRVQLGRLLVAPEVAGGGLRSAIRSPVDPSTFQSLLRVEDVGTAEMPVLEPEVQRALLHVVHEHREREQLVRAGLEPTRSVLLVGPPGVGKTMSARFLARELGLPLLTLDLAAVMSSYLGKTGQNLRAVLDHARAQPCVLFLDEFDALAKRRDDPSDIGELKRIVNVLLLEIEQWPSHGLLLAATNHPEILDRAVERRFGRVVALPVPSEATRRALVLSVFPSAAVPSGAPARNDDLVGGAPITVQPTPQSESAARRHPSRSLVDALAVELTVALLDGQSSSAIVRYLTEVRREAILSGADPHSVLLRRAQARLKHPQARTTTRAEVPGVGAGRMAGEADRHIHEAALYARQRTGVALVREHGQSYRAAAKAVGLSHMTVARAVQAFRDGEPATAPADASNVIDRADVADDTDDSGTSNASVRRARAANKRPASGRTNQNKRRASAVEKDQVPDQTRTRRPRQPRAQ